MTYFLKSGNKFNVSSKEELDLYEKLPVGNYTIKINQMTNQYYLEAIDNFEHSSKIYGDTEQNINRIVNTFNLRKSSTGILLTGEKGSGKTLLAKLLSIELAKLDVPTIVINEAHCGETFNNFIQNIEQPVMIFFDEFEKIYNKETQNQILTLLDGVYPSKKLFVLTCNNKYELNKYLNNRPGRIYYTIDYKGLTEKFITEYCNDNLNNKTHIDQICRITNVFNAFNFDMLKALIEEINRYDESPQEALNMLNIKPEFSIGNDYNVSIKLNIDGVLTDVEADKKWYGKPLIDTISVDYKDFNKDSTDYDWVTLRYTNDHLKNMSPKGNSFEFINEEGNVLKLTKIVPKEVNYYGKF